MTGAWESVLARWGQEMTVVRGDERLAVRAFIESCADEEPVTSKTPLGIIHAPSDFAVAANHAGTDSAQPQKFSVIAMTIEMKIGFTQAAAIFFGSRLPLTTESPMVQIPTSTPVLNRSIIPTVSEEQSEIQTGSAM